MSASAPPWPPCTECFPEYGSWGPIREPNIPHPTSRPIRPMRPTSKVEPGSAAFSTANLFVARRKHRRRRGGMLRLRVLRVLSGARDRHTNFQRSRNRLGHDLGGRRDGVPVDLGDQWFVEL